jgi:D-alanyl-D-alanine carboxypeptidase
MKKFVLIYFILICICVLTGAVFFLKNTGYSSHFDTKTGIGQTSGGELPLYKLSGAADKYAVIKYNEDINPGQFSGSSYAALLIDNTEKEALVSFNAYKRIYPASTTKLMTAIVVCDAVEKGQISLDDMVHINDYIYLPNEDAVVSDIDIDDQISVRNLLFGLLIRSYNDYAVVLAEYVGGDVTSFANMMNEKAAEIGATGTHFVNPHGLHDDKHYTTAYDMYLIINEAAKYDIIQEIDKYSSYSYTYLDSDGMEKEDDISPTNMFLSGNYLLPSNIKIKEWKTGTTMMAGSVLTMIVEIDGKEYTMFIADSIGSEDLYQKYTVMFNLTSQ